MAQAAAGDVSIPPSNRSPPPHFTAKTLAVRWAVTDQHVYNLISRGELACLKIGNAIRITADQVADYERKNISQGGPHQDVADPSFSNPSDS